MTAAHAQPAHEGGKRSDIIGLGGAVSLIENQQAEVGGSGARRVGARAITAARPGGGFFLSRAGAGGLPRKGGAAWQWGPPCAHRSIFPPDADAANMVGLDLGPGGRGAKPRFGGPGAGVARGAGR